MPEDFMAQFEQEGDVMESDKDFMDTINQTDNGQEENDTPSESPAENNDEDTNSPSQEGETEAPQAEETPDEDNKVSDRLDKNPRFKEVIEEKNFYKSQVAELTELVKRATQQPQVAQQDQVSIPEWFRGIYGDDVAAYQNYLVNERTSIIEQAKREIVEEQQRKIAEKEAAVQRWNDYSTDSMDKLQAEGKAFDRNELMAVMLKFQPTDAMGNFDFSKGYEILELQSVTKRDPEQSKARKEIAEITSTTQNTAEKRRDYAVPGQFRGMSPYDLGRS